MTAPSTANTKFFITWCLDVRRPAQFYFDRLGISVPDHKRNVKGTPKFEGAVASDCSALFRDTCDIVNNLVDNKYETKDGIRTAALDGGPSFIYDMTQSLVRKYGPVIWGPSEPFMTRIKEPEYPQHLVYNVVADSDKYVVWCRGLPMSSDS
jgi:hypothetical protein